MPDFQQKEPSKGSIYSAVGLGLFLVCSVLFAFSIRPLVRHIEQINESHTQDALNFSVWGINNILNKHISLSQQIASRSALRQNQADFLAGKISRKEFLASSVPKLRDAVSVQAYSKNTTGVQAIFRFAPSGEHLYQVGNTDGIGQDIVEKHIKKCLKQDDIVSLVDVNNHRDKWEFFYCSTIIHKKAGIVGFDLVVIDGIALTDFMTEFSNKALSFVFSDTEGKILFDGNPSATPGAIAALKAVLAQQEQTSPRYTVFSHNTSLKGLTLNAIVDNTKVAELVNQQQKNVFIALPLAVLVALILLILGLRPLLQKLDAQSRLIESREIYQSLFMSSDMVMLIVDPENGTILDTNPVADAFYGYPHNKLVGMTLDKIANKTKNRGPQPALHLETGETTAVHFMADGEPRNVEIHSSYLYREGRKVLFSIINDITSKLEQTEELKAKHTRLVNIIESTNAGTWEMNVQNGNITVNNNWAERLGYTLDELQPVTFKTMINLTHPDDVALTREKFEEHLKDQNTPFEMEVRLKHKSGHWVWVYVSGKVIDNDESGAPLLMYGTNLDISTLKQTEEKLKEIALDFKDMAFKAEQANQTKSEFIANMSHELRTPLNAIHGFAQVMDMQVFGVLNEKYSDYAKSIVKSSELLLKLINELLDLSRVESGAQELHEENMLLCELLDQTKDMVKQYKNANTLDIQSSCSPRPLDIFADRQLIQQILLNLLSNAIKFTEPGGHVTLQATVNKNNEPVITVTDDGIGLTEEAQKMVLEPFYQVENIMTKTHQGTGLGLTLVKKFAEMHGGIIDVKSKQGKGTTFTVTLPPERFVGNSASK